jgi:hypothetical protein
MTTRAQVEADLRKQLEKRGETCSEQAFREAVDRIMFKLDEKRREKG